MHNKNNVSKGLLKRYANPYKNNVNMPLSVAFKLACLLTLSTELSDQSCVHLPNSHPVSMCVKDWVGTMRHQNSK